MPHKVTRREFIESAVATTALAASGAGAVDGAPARRPNVLFILADDLGYGDLSCYGRPDYQTPVLDRFAREGVKFTSNYAAAPVCTPTRCAYITGRYPQRLPVGLEEPLKKSSPPNVGLPPEHPTIARSPRCSKRTATTRHSSGSGISAGSRNSGPTVTGSTSSSAC